MKKIAFKAGLLATVLGIVLPQVAICDDASTGELQPIAQGTAGDLMPVEHGVVPADEGHLGHGPHGCYGIHGYGVDSGTCHPEALHQHYLQSGTGGHAEYTHRWNLYHANQSAWHGAYYNAQWGRPLALVVPPTSDNHVSWSWGVGNTNLTPLYHQFGRGNPAVYPQGSWGRFRPTPYWPSHTDQFGVYPVRGPW